MRKTTSIVIAAATATAFYAAPAVAQNAAAMRSDLPPDPRPGVCYGRVMTPGQTRQERRPVIIQEATERYQITPARYQWVQEPIVIEEGYDRIEVIPARFENQKRTVVIEPERREYRVTEPVFETVTERVLVRDAYAVWKRGCNQTQVSSGSLGDAVCGVRVPAQFKTVQKRVLKTPARVVTKIIPAKTEEIVVRTLVEKPRRRIVRVPPKTKLTRVRKLVQEARVEKVAVPAKRKIITETVKVSEDRMEWRPVLCEAAASDRVISDLQRALRRAGFNPGRIDGDLGPATLRAVEGYQKANNLPAGGVLIETLNRLNVRVRG